MHGASLISVIHRQPRRLPDARQLGTVFPTLMYNDEASKYRVLSHNTAMINYYGCVLIQQIFGLYRVPVYSFLEYLPCFQEIFRYIDRRQKFSKRIFIKFDRNNNFFYICTKRKTTKNLKHLSLSLSPNEMKMSYCKEREK